jgi:tRNA dimethylallyltransferase
MDIGTDKPTIEDRAAVHHHLIDVADPDETWSLADFQKAARDTIFEIARRGRLPFLVGGTGQYVRALVEGWHIPKQEPDIELRRELESLAAEEGSSVLVERLEKLDPQALKTIDPRNTRRIVRALEVIYRTGEPFSAQRRRIDPFITPLVIGLIRSRPELYLRIDRRIDDMMETGFIDEVRSLLNSGYSPDIPSFSAIGYREIAAYLAGELSQDEAVALMKKRSRQLVRRQANWFKADDPSIHWFSLEEGTLLKINLLISNFLPEKLN